MSRYHVPEAAELSTSGNTRSAPTRFGTARVVTSAAIVLALTAPGQTAGLSVLIDPIISDLGLSRSVVSTAYLVGTLSGALALPAIGAAVDRYGPRRILAAVAFGFGAILLLASTVSNLFGLGLAFVGLRMFGQGALSLVATTAVALHVSRRRGLAQGLTSAFGAAGISLAPVLIEALAGDHGFRTVWVVEGLVIWAIALPLALLGLPRDRRRPAHPAADAQADPEEPQPAGPEDVRQHGSPRRRWGRDRRWRRTRHQTPTAPGDWTPAQARRTGFFWVVTAAISTVAMLATGVNFHQIALLGERGLSPTEAAANFLPQTLTGLASTIVAGMVADRVNPRTIVVACMAALGIALAAGGFVHPGWSAFAFGAALGIAGNGLRVLEATTFPNTFGLSHIGAIRGYVTSATVAASAFGPLALSLGHDLTGSFRPILLASTLVPAAVAVAALFVRQPSPRPR